MSIWCSGRDSIGSLGCSNDPCYCSECTSKMIKAAVADCEERWSQEYKKLAERCRDAERRLGDMVSERTREVLL